MPLINKNTNRNKEKNSSSSSKSVENSLSRWKRKGERCKKSRLNTGSNSNSNGRRSNGRCHCLNLNLIKKGWRWGRRSLSSNNSSSNGRSLKLNLKKKGWSCARRRLSIEWSSKGTGNTRSSRINTSVTSGRLTGDTLAQMRTRIQFQIYWTQIKVTESSSGHLTHSMSFKTIVDLLMNGSITITLSKKLMSITNFTGLLVTSINMMYTLN